MKLEIKSNDVIYWLQDKGIPVYNTHIFLTDYLKIRGIKESDGVFLPRFHEGYVFIDGANIDKLFKRYIHEISHGSFIENFYIGKKIADLDKRIYEKECELFGDNDITDIYIVTTQELDVKSRKISKNEAMKISKIEFKEDKDVFEIDKKEFDAYLSLSRQIGLVYSNYLLYMEGFAMLTMEEILKSSFDNSNFSEPYKSGLESLKTIKEKLGFKGLIEKLHKLK